MSVQLFPNSLAQLSKIRIVCFEIVTNFWTSNLASAGSVAAFWVLEPSHKEHLKCLKTNPPVTSLAGCFHVMLMNRSRQLPKSLTLESRSMYEMGRKNLENVGLLFITTNKISLSPSAAHLMSKWTKIHCGWIADCVWCCSHRAH